MCMTPIKWPLEGPLGTCVEGDPGRNADGHVAPAKLGRSRLPLYPRGASARPGELLPDPVDADGWSCLNCGCFWLEPRDDRPTYNGPRPALKRRPGGLRGDEIGRLLLEKAAGASPASGKTGGP